MKYELKTRQVCLFFIAFMPITKLFMVPSVMAGYANEDMWISALISCLLDIGTLCALIYACKLADAPFFTILERSFGKTVSKIIMAIYFIFFTLKAFLPINEQKDYVEFTLYTLLSTTFYFFPFFIICFYFCTKKLRAVGRVAEICWLFSLIGFIVLITLSFSNADFTAILPLGANGFSNIFKGTMHSLPWFGDSVYLMFFLGEFAYHKKDGIKILGSYLLGVLMILIFMVIFYCIFTSIAHRQRFALTEISKYTTVINNTGRFDYLGILMILLSSIFSISMPLFFGSRILNYIFNFKKRWITPLITVGIQLLTSIFFSEFLSTMETIVTDYCIYGFIVMQNLLPIFSIFIAKRRLNYEHQTC